MAMKKYRKKPVIIEAEKYNLGKEVEGVCRKNDSPFMCVHCHTLEGVYPVREGDWIIKGVRGEFYPCRADIFEETYEPVEEEPCAE